MEQHWYVDIFRALFGILDGIVYGLISTAYNLIEEIAHYKIFSTEAIGDITGRIYAVLSIFMLFKVSFSFINYMINPDSFTDKEKGVQKVIMNIVIMFIMLVMCPWGFEQLWNLQANILDENIIGNFIFADNENTGLTQNQLQYDPVCGDKSNNPYTTAASNGDYIALMTLKGFYQLYSEDELGKKYGQFNDDFKKIIDAYCGATTTDDLLISRIYNADTATTWVNSPFDEDYYLIHYRFIMSTAVGVVVLLILISFAMDVGMRVVKLSFLELIAPIPIISYIDPASGKNGMFKKWLREVGGTWASVFIRLLALFFAVSVIQKVGDLQYIGTLNNHEAGFWVQLFVIIGALMFAKKLPQLITDITGIKLDSGFNINPLKKVRDQALGGKQLIGAASTIAGGATGLSAFAGKKIAERIKNGAKNKADLAEKRNNVAQRNFDKNPTQRNMDRALRTEQKLAEANRNLEEIKNKMAEKQERKANRKESRQANRLFNVSMAGIRGVIQIKDAMLEGYKQGKELKLNPIKIGEKSSKLRDYKDQYNIADRIKDRATDFVGIKNDSGTTSAVKEKIQDLQRQLEKINRNIEIASRSFSTLQTQMGPAEFSRAISMNADGSMTINGSYHGQHRNELQSMIDLMNTLDAQKKDAEKALKRQQYIKDQRPERPSK